MNPIIVAENLSKVYRLYAKPHHRLMDMFGLLKNDHQAYTEHAALDNINLQVSRGEKVAIIGRNGAGKSTLLKIITNVIRPTSGTIEVDGKIHALLQIGTGFHPEFTGRENVYGYLAQLGLTGKEADVKVREIIEFAELEEYIDQPMKTYSTGMGVRLMFSTSTAIIPSLLVLDEVMGVGDSYFAQKSYDRMKELCEGQGTTLLMVTHDIYSAAKICDRAIWIDRGRVLIDGDASTVVKGYENSIRQQEEQRLRIKKQKRLEALHKEGVAFIGTAIVIEVKNLSMAPPTCLIYFGVIGFQVDGECPINLPLGENAFSNEKGHHLQQEGCNWGERLFWEGRPARPMLNYGSPFHKVSGVFVAPYTKKEINEKCMQFVVEYWSEEPCDLEVSAHIEGKEYRLGKLPPSQKNWERWEGTLSLSKNNLANERFLDRTEFRATDAHGTGLIYILDFEVLDEKGKETVVLSHGKPMEFVLRYKIRKPNLKEKAQVLIAFHKDGVNDVCRMITRDLLFDSSSGLYGRVRLCLPKLVLANGEYTISLMVVKEGYFDEEQYQFYSINPGVYCALSRVLEVKIEGGGTLGSGTGVVLDGEWTIQPEKNEGHELPPVSKRQMV